MLFVFGVVDGTSITFPAVDTCNRQAAMNAHHVCFLCGVE